MKIGQYFENPEQIIWEIEEKFSSYHLPPLGYSSSREEEKGIEIEREGIQKRDGAPHGTPYSQDEKD